MCGTQRPCTPTTRSTCPAHIRSGRILVTSVVMSWGGGGGREGIQTSLTLLQGWDSSYDGEMADFATAILQHTPLAAGPGSAVDDLRVLLALFKSAATNAWVNTADV